MLDLYTIAEQFIAVPDIWSGGDDDRMARGPMSPWPHLKLYDPHAEADAWIAASEEQRAALRLAADAKLVAVRKELARTRVLSKEDILSRKREDMRRWRYNNGEEHKQRCRTWREANPMEGRKYMKAYRTKVLADPVRAEAYRAKERERVRNLRARKKSA